MASPGYPLQSLTRKQAAGCWAVDIKTRLAVSHDGFLAEGTKDVSQGAPRDFIVADDFIYSEPVAE
ncbi:hypothetical protein [Foetidibacter luteolus]|uniref:hypothetical protein n=1 Tax=Foetidibacter luteolus TaxID=2608880 RepID=UPI00129AF72E|nr:hypothetical protein [Foetidibacter luteolus]